MKRGQMSWQIIALLVAVIFLTLMLVFIASSKTGMTDITDQLVQNLRI